MASFDFIDNFVKSVFSAGGAQRLDPGARTAQEQTEFYAGGFGFTPDYQGFRNTTWGQTQPVNYRLLTRAFLEVPEVYGCVKIRVDYVIGDGYELEGPQLHVKRVEELLRRNHFNSQLRDLATSQEVYGDAYVEVLRGGAPAENDKQTSAERLVDLQKRLDGVEGHKQGGWVKVVDDGAGAFDDDRFKGESIEYYSKGEPLGGVAENFFVRDAASIRIDYNEHGEPIKYIQRILHRRVDFYPTEMIHLPVNLFGGRVYGMSNLAPLLRTIRNKFDAEEHTNSWLQRNGLPRMIYQLMSFSKEQVERVKQTLQSVQHNQDVVLAVPTKDSLTTTPVAPKNVDMQWAEYLAYLREQVFVALQVPPALLGISQSANRSVADVNMEMFDKAVRGRKRELESQLNHLFFVRDVVGYDDVKIKFKFDNVREELRKAQEMQLLSSISPLLTPDEIRKAGGFSALADTDTSSFDILNDLKSKEMAMQQQFAPAMPGKFGGVPGRPGAGKFNAAQQGVQSPNANPDKEDNAERQNTEQQRDTKDSLKYAHPSNPSERYEFGAVPVDKPDAYDVRAYEEYFNAVRRVNDNPTADDVNHDRVPTDERERPKKKKKAEELREKEQMRGESGLKVRETNYWLPPSASDTGQTTSIASEQEHKSLAAKIDQVVAAVRFLDKNDETLGGIVEQSFDTGEFLLSKKVKNVVSKVGSDKKEKTKKLWEWYSGGE